MASIQRLSVVIHTIASYFCAFIHPSSWRTGLWYLKTTEYCVLPVLCLFVVAGNGAHGYQCSNSLLLHAFCGVPVLILAHLRTLVLDYGFCYLIDRSAFDCVSAYVALQCSAEVDWTPCKTDDRLYYCIFESGPVHDVPTGVVEKCKRNTSGNLITGRTLTSCEVSCPVTAERRATFEEVGVLMQF